MNKFKKIRCASILGIVGNLFLLIIKALIGFMTNSQAMIADSFNSAGDIFTSLLTFIGNKIASKPSDEDHNLGHGKAEYIFSMIISIIMILMSTIVFKDSVHSLISKNSFRFSFILIIVCIVTIIVKFSLFIYTIKIAKKYDNLLIKANSIDHRNDCFITFLTLISCTMGAYKIYFIDGIVGVLISIWILYTSIRIFIECYDVLMDKCMPEELKGEVLSIIDKYSEVHKINHFNSTPIGYKYQISFTIFVDGNLSTYESHEIANNLEKEITNTIENIHLTVIHVNPIENK